MSDENTKIKIDNDTVTLAELAGLNIDSFDEKHAGEALPKGGFVFETMDGENAPRLVVLGEGDAAKAACVFEFKVIDVIAVTDSDFKGSEQELIGKIHRETFFFSGNLADAIGYLRAFVGYIGVNNTGELGAMLARCPGARFQALIGKRKNKDDHDIIYTNIVRDKKKIKPMAAAASSTVAAAVA
jgi:hypothetical protein